MSAAPVTVPEPAAATDVAAAAPPTNGMGVSLVELVNEYAGVFVLSFAVALLVTPLVRRIALAKGVVDRPDPRKVHREPTAYLGGLAVLAGVLAGVVLSRILGVDDDAVQGGARPVPWSVVVGMIAIALTGLGDDVWNWDPRTKVAGQLLAAAALAIERVGVRVAEGALVPLFGDSQVELVTFLGETFYLGDVYYWVGTAIIAVFVLGGCNAANLIDGLDGLLSGVIAIAVTGLLAISLLMTGTADDVVGQLDVARIVLCLAVLGAVLGFLPHNFNPASIFLGDCGSLLLGYLSVTIILMLGDRGNTHLVLAGLIVFAVPIMDTALAMLRRALSGVSMSTADDQHIHHQLKRTLGGVKRAVAALYAIALVFAILGVSLAALVTLTEIRVRIVYAAAIVLFGCIGVTAVKAARRHQHRAVRVPAGGTAPARPAASSSTAPRTGDAAASASERKAS